MVFQGCLEWYTEEYARHIAPTDAKQHRLLRKIKYKRRIYAYKRKKERKKERLGFKNKKLKWRADVPVRGG